MSFSRRKNRTDIERARSLEPEARSPEPKSNAYVSALVMLARRELSEAQVRDRLLRKGFEPADIDMAVERLKLERAIDDERVAEAIAHTAISVRGRGKLRVRRQIEQAGIARAIAHRVADAAFGEIDPEALLEAALAKRLRHGQSIANRTEMHRLYRYLVGQGFDPDRVLRLLEARSVK